MKWYVLRAISGKEAKVKEYIDAEIKNNHFNGYVSQVLIPTEKVFQVRNGKRIGIEIFKFDRRGQTVREGIERKYR